MMKRIFLLPLMLAACVAPPVAPQPDTATVITVDGTAMVARQEYNWPQMIAPVDASTGKTVIVQSGTADTVIIAGSADSRSRAIRALAKFCGRPIDENGFDTQFVYQDPKTGDWWFDGFCG